MDTIIDRLQAGLDNRRIDLNKVVALAESLKPDPIANYAGPMLYMLSSDKFSLHQKLEAAIYLPREVMEYNRLHFLPETPIPAPKSGQAL